MSIILKPKHRFSLNFTIKPKCSYVQVSWQNWPCNSHTKCWLNFLLKCCSNAFVSADAQIVEWRSQITVPLKGECFPKVYQREAWQSEIHSKYTPRYKKKNVTMRTRWNIIFYMYLTCSVFVDLLSKQMLARYKRSYEYKETLTHCRF